MTDVPTKAGEIQHRDIGYTLVYSDDTSSVRAPIKSVLHTEDTVTVWVALGDGEDSGVPFDFAPATEVKIANAQT